MIRLFCPDVYYWEDIIFTGKLALLLLTCGLPYSIVLVEALICDTRLRNTVKVHVLVYSLLTIIWICCVLGLIFIPSASSIHSTCLGD